MLKWLFGSDTDSKIQTILAPGAIGYLSASCCNPAAVGADVQLVDNLRQAMEKLGLQQDVHMETLTGAQAGMRSTLPRLSLQQGKVVTKVMTLFSTKGMNAFPILFVNGDVAFYGGVPTADEIEAYLTTHPPSPVPPA